MVSFSLFVTCLLELGVTETYHVEPRQKVTLKPSLSRK